MTIRKLSNDDIKFLLLTDLQEWKIEAAKVLDSICHVNCKLSEDDIITIIQSGFYDDINDESLNVGDILDWHYLQEFDYCKDRNVWLALHDIYNR